MLKMYHSESRAGIFVNFDDSFVQIDGLRSWKFFFDFVVYVRPTCHAADVLLSISLDLITNRLYDK